MTDWKAVARAHGLQIPDDQIERIAPTLNGLEEIFRPLPTRLPHETEPAVRFGVTPEDEP